MENQNNHKSDLQEKKRKFSWKKLIFSILFLVLAWFVIVPFLTEDITTPVNNHLKALRENKLTEAYYRFTTPDFQTNTTLQQFKDFFQKHPEIAKNKSFEYSDSSINGNLGWVEGKIISDDGKQVVVQYGLKKQDDEWRIYAIKIGEFDKSKPVTDPKEISTVIAPIENQLELLKKKELSQAYDAVVSHDFKEHTSLSEFRKFVDRYPMLLDHSSVIYKGVEQGTHTAHVLVELVGEHVTYPLSYKLVKEGSDWKIWNMHLVVPMAKESSTLKANLEKLETSVKNHLNYIKNNKIVEAYQTSVAKGFKEVTPFDKFEDFVEAFPILANYHSLEFGELGMEDDVIGVIQVDFYSPQGMTVIEYTLSQEDGAWKILGIKVIDHKEVSHGMVDTKESPKRGAQNQDITISALAKVIEDQINAIKKGLIQDAYFTYTSDDFQKATDLNTFETFMKKHPAYANHDSSLFDDLTFNSNIATVKGQLKTKKGTRFPVEYDMVMENNQWKVLHVEIQAPIALE